MQNQITNQNKNKNKNKNNKNIPIIANTTRTYSFQQNNHDQTSQYCIKNDDLWNFVKDVQMINEIHNVRLDLGNLLVVNSNDVNTVQEAINDVGLAKQIRDRMTKYLKVVDYVSNGDMPQKLPKFATVQQQQKSNSKTSIINPFEKQIQNQKNNYKNIQQVQLKTTKQSQKDKMQANPPSYMQPTHLSTSRYAHNKQKKYKDKSQSKLFIQNKIQVMKSPQSKSRSKSKNGLNNLNSRVSISSNSSNNYSHSKHFHKIQLKSVKRVGTLESEVQSSRLAKDAYKFNKESQINEAEQAKQQQTRKNILSKRNQQKNKSQLLSQNTKIQDSRFKTSKQNLTTSNLQKSRFSSNSFSKSHKQIKQPKKKYDDRLSPNRHLERCCNDSRIRQKSAKREKQSTIQNQAQVRKDINLAYQTVQKSTDFLLMLRMMSEQ